MNFVAAKNLCVEPCGTRTCNEESLWGTNGLFFCLLVCLMVHKICFVCISCVCSMSTSFGGIVVRRFAAKLVRALMDSCYEWLEPSEGGGAGRPSNTIFAARFPALLVCLVFVCLLVSCFVCLYVGSFACLFVGLFVSLFDGWLVCLFFVCLFVCWSVPLFVCLFVCRFGLLFVLLFVCSFVASFQFVASG